MIDIKNINPNSFFDELDIGYYATNADNVLIYANDAFKNFIGIERYSDIGNKKILDWIEEKYIELYLHYIEIAKENGVYKSSVISFKTSSNVIVYLEQDIKYTEINNEGCFVFLCKNITRKKLIETNLRKSKLKAQDSDKLKSSFLANLSHEIRTPMNAIIGFSELLIENNFDEVDRKKYLHYIFNSGNILLDLIDNIVDIAKIQTGQIAIKPSTTNIDTILYEIYTSYSQLCKSQKDDAVSLVLNRKEKNKILKLKTDPLRFRQIFSNLLNNALKFTENGVIEFGYDYVEVQSIRYIEFYVKDTGVGFSTKNQEFIFDRFYRENEAMKMHRGAGLGLTISKSLVNLLGGTIAAESELGKGSRFYIRFPFTEVELVDQSIKQSELTKQVVNWDNKTILVAEDEDINFIFIEELLRKYNLNILRARNGAEALKLYQEHINIIELILMDIKMPIMDGYEATTKIKQVNSKIAIVAQTAFTMDGEREKILNSGFDDYIAKPIKPNLLVEIMEKYISSFKV
ncbi:MAG: response regulator [Bacteroidales bacterium]|nr:response regulator [Bacteroidales bacterium]